MQWSCTHGTPKKVLHLPLSLLPQIQLSLFELWGTRPATVMPDSLNQTLTRAVQQIGSLWWIVDHPRHRQRANALLTLALCDVADHFTRNDQSEHAAYDERIHTLQTMITSRLNNWTVNDMAEAVGMHRSSLTQLFIDQMGMSPSDYLDERRHQLALSGIANPNWPLAHLATSTGHSSQSSFCRWFKKRHGVSPSHYRQMCLNSTPAGDD